MPKRLYMTRHAQAEHNVNNNYEIHDAPLTALGRQQATELPSKTEAIQGPGGAQLLVTSPLKRTLQTTLLGYPQLIARLRAEGKNPVPIALPQLQEANAYPCDTGSDVSVLEADPEFAGVDFSLLREYPDWTSKKGFWASDVESLHARGKWLRRWFRDRPEEDIVFVAHGDILRYMAGRHLVPWNNAEVRLFTFRSMDDEDAILEPLEKVAVLGEPEPTSSEIAKENN